MKVVGRQFAVDWARLFILLTGVAVSLCAGYFLQPMISGNKEAINTIVTIFSILAGFLIAVITFIADPVIKGANGWQDLQLKKRNVRNKIFRHRLLFYFYLISLGLALAMFLLPSTFIKTTIWLERGFLTVSTFVFLASFKLPGSLMDLQMARYDAELEDKKPEVLKSPEKPNVARTKKP